jgi:hypothetical protein
VGFSCDPSHVCLLDATAMEYAGVLLQALWFVAGGALSLALVIGVSVFFRRT